MVFIPSCFQPPEKAWTTPLVPNPRSEADGRAGHPPVPSLPRPLAAISGAADEPLCMWKCSTGTDVVRHAPDSSWWRL